MKKIIKNIWYSYKKIYLMNYRYKQANFYF